MNKILKLSLLGTLIASSSLAIILPIVSCSNSSEVLKATVNPDELDLVYEKYNTEMTSKTTYEEQKQLYDSWVTNDTLTEETSPAIAELETSIDFKDINEEDVAWETAVEKLVYGLKENFPDTKDSVIPPIIINVIIKKGYSVTTPNQLSITIDNLGKVVADPISKDKIIIPTIDEEKLNEVKLLYKKEFTSVTKYEAQRALYDSFVQGHILTETNSPAFTQLKETITFKNGNNKQLTWNDVVKNSTYGTKQDKFPLGIDVPVPPLTIKINIKDDLFIEDTSILTIKIVDLGQVIQELGIEQSTLPINQIWFNYQFEFDKPTTSEEQKALYDSFNGRVTEANSILENYRLLTKESLLIKSIIGTPLSLDKIIDHWVYDVRPPFPLNSGDNIPDIKITAILKPGYDPRDPQTLTINIANFGEVI